MRSSLALAFGALAVMATARGQAQERSRIAFSWVRAGGTEDCPSARALRAGVRERLGYDPFAPDAEVSLEATVVRDADRWTVRVYKRSAEGRLLGERTLSNDASDCGALGEAVTLALALAIDPDAAVRRPQPEPEPEPEPIEAPAEPELEVAPEEVPEDRPPPAAATRPVRARLGLGAALGRELVPGIGYGFRLTADGAIARLWRWTVGAELWPEREVSGNGARLGVGLSQGSVGMCVGRSYARGAVHGCGSLTVGALHVVVYDPVPLDPGDRVFLAARAVLRGSVRLTGPLQLGLWAAVAVPLIDHDLFVEGDPSPVFSPARVAPLAGIELLVAL